MSGQLRTQVLENTYLYGNLGAARYDWDVEIDHQPLSSRDEEFKTGESGLSLFAAAGVKYQWTHMEFGLEYQHLAMGDLDGNNLVFQLGYRF